MAAIDVALVPVIAIGPAQYRSKVRTSKATDGAAEQDFGIRGSWTEHAVVGDAVAIGDLTRIADNGEETLKIGISPPGLSIRSRAPMRLIGSLEGVLRQRRSRRRRRRGCGRCRGRRRRCYRRRRR